MRRACYCLSGRYRGLFCIKLWSWKSYYSTRDHPRESLFLQSRKMISRHFCGTTLICACALWHGFTTTFLSHSTFPPLTNLAENERFETLFLLSCHKSQVVSRSTYTTWNELCGELWFWLFYEKSSISKHWDLIRVFFSYYCLKIVKMI